MIARSKNHALSKNRPSPVLRTVPETAPIAPGSGSAGAMVREALNTIVVRSNTTTDYFAGIVWGTLRARISTPVTGGTVTVTAIRPEQRQGWSPRSS
jgi:hypothetical protein